MKICWDNLENAKLNSKGNFKIDGLLYYEHDSCYKCHEPFLGRRKDSLYCNISCGKRGMIVSDLTREKLRMKSTGKKHTEETKKKLSIAGTGRKHSQKSKDKMGESHKGKKHSEETKRKMSEDRKGKSKTEDHKRKIGEANSRRIWKDESKAKVSVKAKIRLKDPSKNPMWKGGYVSKNIPMYDLYVFKLEPYEECRRQEEDPNILEIRCTYCRIWYTPTDKEVRNRITGIENNDKHKFYHSAECKEFCPLFHKSAKALMRQDAIKAGRITLKELKNEVPGWIRDKVLELDVHTCQMCGSKDKLHVHHEIPQKRNQMLAADIDNSITLCQNCHKWVHTQIDGCRYHELAYSEIC